MEQKYNLEEPTQEEKDKFMKEFTNFCDSRLMYFEPVPQWVREDLYSPWQLTCQILLQKKVPIINIDETNSAS